MDFEFYETPRTFSRYLFDQLLVRGHRVDGRCFEPCVGSRAIIEPADLCTHWTTNDLDPQWRADFHLDATREDVWRMRPIDWTVSNPPFTPAVEIINRALEYSRVGVAMHLRASIHEVLKTGPRRSWLHDNPPNGILWLPRFAYQRSKTTGKWTTDSVCACWVIWLRGVREQFIDYAPGWVLEDLEAETPAYRDRMDALMAARARRTA